MLAEHPEILRRLRQEILEKIGPQRRPTYDDFRDMKFLKAVINGALFLDFLSAFLPLGQKLWGCILLCMCSGSLLAHVPLCWSIITYLSPFNLRYAEIARLIFDHLSFYYPEHRRKRQLGQIRHLEGSRCIFRRIRGNAFGWLLNYIVFVQALLSVLGHHILFSWCTAEQIYGDLMVCIPYIIDNCTFW